MVGQLRYNVTSVKITISHTFCPFFVKKWLSLIMFVFANGAHGNCLRFGSLCVLPQAACKNVLLTALAGLSELNDRCPFQT